MEDDMVVWTNLGLATISCLVNILCLFSTTLTFGQTRFDSHFNIHRFNNSRDLNWQRKTWAVGLIGHVRRIDTRET